MKPRRYSSEGIVLSSRKYSESDRILSIYTRDYGKVDVIAKGVRKLKSRKRGSLEVFAHVKFAASRGKGLDIITEVEMITSFNEFRKNLKKTSVAYFFVETVNKLTKVDEANFELFDLLLGYLKDLEGNMKLKALREEFVEEILVLTGYWPIGKTLKRHDKFLETVVERRMNSVRVGKKMLR